MLKACKYCGGVHNRKHECASKPKRTYTKRTTDADTFRSGQAWKNKREEIKQRDLYMCQLCNRNLYNTISQQYNGVNISIHHIDKIVEAWGKRLENNNLITLCDYHHAMADDGDIPVNILKQIASEQEKQHNTS